MAVSGASNDDLRRGLELLGVSRETEQRLSILVDELRRWQSVKNLVGSGTLDRIWIRHVADSAQLLDHAPDARRWIDLGSGAGFPGLVLGVLLRDRPDAQIHLVESNGRKCAFLRHAARVTGANAVVHQARLETVVGRFAGSTDVVTARALARLVDLIAWTQPLLQSGAIGLFPKGREAQAELTEAAQSWTFSAQIVPSRTSSDGRILCIKGLREPP
jgi:16S rRNA (guanine527-N7)-methyltransferase